MSKNVIGFTIETVAIGFMVALLYHLNSPWWGYFFYLSSSTIASVGISIKSK